MPPHSRNKGVRAEAEVERILRDAGYSTDRNLSGRNQISGDILVHVENIAIEVRRRETLSLSQWSRDHEASTPDHFTPAIVYRRSREPWRISLKLDQFLDLLNGGKHGN